MSAKRACSQEKDATDSRGSASSSPPSKRQKLVTFEPMRLPAISTVSELDRHTLVFQNRKLAERLEQKKRVERDLRSRIENLEQRQIRDDAFSCTINRHWNRLDEDVRILLHRFDADSDFDNELETESDNTSFLTLLSQWDREELDRELNQRVEFSKRDIAKLIKAFDRLTQRNEKTSEFLRSKINSGENVSREENGGHQNEKEARKIDAIDNQVLAENLALRQENERLQKLAARLQEKNHLLSSNHSRMKDRLCAAETKLDEFRKELEESDFQLEKAHAYGDKLEFQLKEATVKLQRAELNAAAVPPPAPADPVAQQQQAASDQAENANSIALDRSQLIELTACLEEQRELSSNRLSELQELTDKHVKALQSIEHLKSQVGMVPDHVILSSVQYCRLQNQFSVLYNESALIRAQSDDMRTQLISSKLAHLKQIEQMESEELLAQKQLRTEMVQLEDQLSQVRREYEMLRVEFEQNLAANEQSGPLNKEMRQLLTSYKVQNGQFRSEVQRFKRKWKDAVSTIAKVQKELDTERKSHENCVHISLSNEEVENHMRSSADQSDKILAELERSGEVFVATENDESDCSDEMKKIDSKDLRRMLRCAQKKCADLELNILSYKQATSEDKIRSETYKQLKNENVKFRAYICCIAKKRGKDFMPGIDEPFKHAKKLEEQIEKFKKEVAGCKQEEETLLTEMEVTGQAFEEMQEQNVRLVQQLKEKDDANFKLMSDRIKTNQQQKLLREEKDLLHEQVTALQNQVEAQNLVVRKLEEKENLLQQQSATVEKEIASRQQALDLHRRKATESLQSLTDHKLQVEKLSAQLNDAQQAMAAKTAALEEESFKIARLQEEIVGQRKRLERFKKLEKTSGTTDEILLEEIRELKEHLTCPGCKVRRKDGVLTKCYHVFCMVCLKTRYETRQRKCPKCNAAFGANDFKRIYIG